MNFTGFSSDDDAPAHKHRKKTYMNQPHLRFEITSDDGFSVKANSIEGKTASLQSAWPLRNTKLREWLDL